MIQLRVIRCFLVCTLFGGSACAQSPIITQKADTSNCSNIVALVSDVNINCSTLSADQQKLLAKIPQLLRQILLNQNKSKETTAKLDELIAAVSRLNQLTPQGKANFSNFEIHSVGTAILDCDPRFTFSDGNITTTSQTAPAIAINSAECGDQPGWNEVRAAFREFHANMTEHSGSKELVMGDLGHLTA